LKSRFTSDDVALTYSPYTVNQKPGSDSHRNQVDAPSLTGQIGPWLRPRF